MRIAQWVNIAHRSRDHAGGLLEYLRKIRSVQVACGSYLNSRVAGLSDQRRQPANFQLQADHDQQVSLAELKEEAGLGLHEVRILIPTGDRFHVDMVATDLRGQRGQIARSRDHPDLRSGFGGTSGKHSQPEYKAGNRKANATRAMSSIHRSS
jgi:hypothetical protein